MARMISRPDSRIRCGRQQHKGGSHQVLETPQYAIVYFLAGSGEYRIGRQRIPFHSGSVIQRFPDQRHQLHFDSNATSVFAALPAPALELMRCYDIPTLSQHVFHPGIDDVLINRFDHLSQELRRRIPQQHAQVAGQILQLLIDVHQHATAMQAGQTQQEFIQHACTLLQSDLHLDLSLHSIAADLGVSYASFRKRFKQLMGMSPGHFRIQQRVEESRQLLMRGHSISQTAELLGYPDVYSFSKQFKKTCGYPPRRFKQLQGLM